MSSSPTIRSLSKKLCLSKSTVQRALAGPAGTSPEVRERVLAAAKEMNYRPDPLFSILGSQSRKHRKNTLMLAFVRRSANSASQEHVGAASFASLQARAEELGYQAEQVFIDDLGAGKRLMDVLYHRGFVGVAIGPDVRASCHPAILANTHLPVVCCGRIDALPLHTVQPDVIQIVRVAWTKMLQAGYKRIGIALGVHSPPVEDDSDRFGAILALQEETLSKRDRVPVLRNPIHDSASLIKWFQKYEPEAVLGFRVRNYFDLRDAGVDFQRVGFCSLHTSTESYGNVQISGVMENEEFVARETVNLLDTFIRHRLVGIPANPMHLLLPGIWIEGNTLGTKSHPASTPKRRRSGPP
jgi:DNA-binding LacI/PurR family transcriptional regulator